MAVTSRTAPRTARRCQSGISRLFDGDPRVPWRDSHGSDLRTAALRRETSVLGRYLALGLVALVASGTSPVGSGSRLGGRPLELVAARGSLWALVCDRGCSGEARRSVGRVVRVDPRDGHVVASTKLAHPSALGAGGAGVFATDFWGNAVRRLDPGTLRVTASLGLTLPFAFVPGDDAFLPEYVAVGEHAIWVSSDRGALARIDPRLARVESSVRLPPDTIGGIAVGGGAVWVAESLLGVARVDPMRSRVVGRIRIARLAVDQVVVAGGAIFAIGGRTSSGALSGGSAVARIDPSRNRVRAVTLLPAGAPVIARGAGALWVGIRERSLLVRIDARTGAVSRLRARIGVALAFAGGRLWTADADGALRQLPT